MISIGTGLKVLEADWKDEGLKAMEADYSFNEGGLLWLGGHKGASHIILIAFIPLFIKGIVQEK